MHRLTLDRLTHQLRLWFPEREFFMRSRGQVRFVTLTTRVQLAATGVAAALLCGWGVSMAAVAVDQYQTRAERAALEQRATQVAQAESRVSAFHEDLHSASDEIERRLEFIEGLLPMLPDDMAAEIEADTADEGGNPTLRRMSAAMPEASVLAGLERRQLAMIARLTAFADRRADAAEATMRDLGINPRTMLASAQDAMGGPLEKLATNADGTIDPRLEKLGSSLARMDALERGLASLPQVMPVDMRMISSGFGYRRDPFTGGAAMHSGLDFRGRTGDPILAAANGKVTFVGTKAGYGKLVEISHGNGLVTRYAHMSAFKAKRGQAVEAGDVIGAIGSTGRSTGPHLHFEVRINDRAVNPRPFLEAAPNVPEDARPDPARTRPAPRG